MFYSHGFRVATVDPHRKKNWKNDGRTHVEWIQHIESSYIVFNIVVIILWQYNHGGSLDLFQIPMVFDNKNHPSA